MVLTCDLDFGTLLAHANSGCPSVIQLRLPAINFAKAWQPTQSALLRFRCDIDEGCLITIDVAKTWIRLLPLRREP
jgi:hypothetical protein